NGIPGEPEDAYVARFNLSGLSVIAQTPSDVGFGTLDHLRVTYNRAVEPDTFSLDDIVSFTGPAGDIPVTGVAVVPGTGNTQFEITFPTQSRPGSYTLVFGPDIQDTFGNLMDQNGNLIPGEVPGDRYTARLEIADPCRGPDGAGYLGCVVDFEDDDIFG